MKGSLVMQLGCTLRKRIETTSVPSVVVCTCCPQIRSISKIWCGVLALRKFHRTSPIGQKPFWSLWPFTASCQCRWSLSISITLQLVVPAASKDFQLRNNLYELPLRNNPDCRNPGKSILSGSDPYVSMRLGF